MQRVAACGGDELYEDGPRLVFVARGVGAHGTAAFVFGVLTFILGMNALLLAVAGLTGQPNLLVGALVTGPAALGCGLALRAVLRARRARLAAPVHEVPVVLVVDRDAGTLARVVGVPFAPLAGARFRVTFQLGSSSKALTLDYVGGSLVVARGSPFHGTVDDLVDALRARGFRVE